MRIDILSLFPEMFSALKTSLLKKATDKNILEINIIDIRDYSEDKHKKCDDYTYGGGAGLLMTPQPISSAIKSIKGYKKALKIYLSPKGERLNQNMVQELAKNNKHLILLCGHYEGVDQRVIDLYIDKEISIGDFVLTGGEIPAMALVDSVSRYISGVLGNSESTEDESFSSGYLEYPQYTRPQIFEGLEVPEVLISGDHKKVDEWRKMQSAKITKERRPDLLQQK